MKHSAVTNHERYLKQQQAHQNRIALQSIREMVYKEIEPIVLALIEKAKEGDHKTAELLFDRTFGKAKENLEISGEIKFSLASLAEQWEEQQKEKLAQSNE
jgi:hypothetical protein